MKGRTAHLGCAPGLRAIAWSSVESLCRVSAPGSRRTVAVRAFFHACLTEPKRVAMIGLVGRLCVPVSRGWTRRRGGKLLATRETIGPVNLSSMATNHPRISAARYYEEPAALLLNESRQSPVSVRVDCSANERRKHHGEHFDLEIQFDPSSYEFEKLRSTLQRHRIVEHGAVGLALIFLPHIADGEVTHVNKRSEKTDFDVDWGRYVLEVSGTEDPARLRRRHGEKIAQASANPRGKSFFVAVSCFGDLTAVFSFHEVHR